MTDYRRDEPPTNPFPAAGYGHPPPAKPRRTGWIIGGVAALVVVLGAGIAVGVVAGQPSDPPPKPVAAPGYSMDHVGNACDLVDPAPLQKWSPTPKGPPKHEEVRPSEHDAGSLNCEMRYTGSDTLNTAEILLDVDFTEGTAPSSYSNWKRGTLAKTGEGKASGSITGVGTEGFWHSEVYGDLVANTRYVLCAVDANVSVRVRLNFSRTREVAQMHRTEVQPIAEAQARKVLNGLKGN
ncbi:MULTISPECIES: hypothetical protein [Amycolatopsis]|uniref:DUF3558 domain-containing protein n=1 Tax=Amycolatopsis dendrobii TaxID=2760662 RepID=A0A7W3W0Y6_9PSEU|nr:MULTISPECIES: hypothetical protein [Amycolatopsis]MBB1156843.1 hypothetical protein [Amycolatopsis dendrobii]UKD53548.1 hypothetical protein L3Q65_37530 [Amycolatopsis sp. FU40]